MVGSFNLMAIIALALSGIAIAVGLWWAAVSRGRAEAILLICLGLIVAIIALSGRDLVRFSSFRNPSPEQPSSPLPPVSSPARKVRGLTLPREVSEGVKAANGNAEEFIGLTVHWDLRLLSATRKELTGTRQLLLFTAAIEDSGSPLIVCDDLPFYFSYDSSVGLRFIVSGVIQRADALEVHLRDVTLDPVNMAY